MRQSLLGELIRGLRLVAVILAVLVTLIWLSGMGDSGLSTMAPHW